MKKFFALIMLSVLGFSACETEIDLNADYRQIPVVYGLLEANKEFQFIKINRSFLGEGNALVAALNPDSSFFTNISPVIEQFNDNEVLKTIALRDTVLPDREDGDFYSSPNKYYYFRNTDGFLEPGNNYRLRFNANGKEVTSETVLLSDFTTSSPRNFAPTVGIVRNDPNIQNKVEYKNFSVELVASPNVRLYESAITVRYTTVYLNNSRVEQEVIIPISEDITNRITGGDNISNFIPGQQIIGSVGNNAMFETNNQDSVRYREIGTVTLRVTAATDDFNTYLESVSPASGVVLEKPQFSNINFGDELGVGIFTSRYNYTKEYEWDSQTLKAFPIATQTEEYRFCSFRPEVQGISRLDCREYQ